MVKQFHPLSLAIDGGGTRCRVAACDGQAVISIETGSANVSTDFDAAIAQLLQGIAGLCTKIHQPLEAVSALPAFVGLAGVTGPVMAARVKAALPLRHVQVADDRPAALRGALGQKSGVVVHCGTGSFYAAQRDGVMRFAGGWGALLGDQASAQWVGRRALRLTLEVLDGMRAPSALTDEMLTTFGDAAGIVSFAGAARPSEFGALAPRVTKLAAGGDLAACEVMRAGADEIAGTLSKLGWEPGQSICLTGGIGPHYRDYLPQTIQASISAPEGDPLEGALALAREMASKIDRETARDHTLASDPRASRGDLNERG